MKIKSYFLNKQPNQGFSLVEMLLASTLFVGLSAVTYSFLQNQNASSLNSIAFQAQNRAATTATERFRNDAMLVDPNWISLGVPVVFPHQGYGLDSNFYRDTTLQSQGELNDGVTFLRRDSQKDSFIEFSAGEFCLGLTTSPTYDASHRQLFEDSMNVSSVFTDDLEVGDWVLVYQDRVMALAVVQSVSTNSIEFRKPANPETLNVQMNSGKTSGLVTEPGVFPTTVDIYGVADNRSDYHCFNTDRATVQKIGNPVSYSIEYATNDGEIKNPSNVYVLGSDNQKKKMLVRTEYTGTAVEREYLSQVDELHITYDLMANVEGGVVTNQGRGQYEGYLLNINEDFTSPADVDFERVFYYTPDIISINMNLINKSPNPKDPTRVMVKKHSVKASFDSISGQNVVNEAISYESQKTNPLSFERIPTDAYDENVGRPFMFFDEHVGGHLMMVPTWRMMTDGQAISPSTGELLDDQGRITIFDNQGCAINGFNGSCEVSDRSSIVFEPQIVGQTQDSLYASKFFPTSVNVLENSGVAGYKVFLVGGVSVEGEFEGGGDPQNANLEGSGNEPVLTRKAGFATIMVPDGQSLPEFMDTNYLGSEWSGNSNCNMAGCQWFTTDEMDTAGDPGDLDFMMDTANIAVSSTGEMLAVPMTKYDSNSSIGIYDIRFTPATNEHGFTVAQPMVTKTSEIADKASNRIVSAIAERTVVNELGEFLPICTSTALSVCDEGGNCTSPNPKFKTGNEEDMGEIRLVKIKDENGDPVYNDQGTVLAKHDYACSSMSVTENNDLLVSGRLGINKIAANDLKHIVGKPGAFDPGFLNLDEVALEHNGQTYYADGYRVDPSTYSDGSNDLQYIGWRGGVSTSTVDGTLSMVTTNTVKIDDGQGGFAQIIDAGIHNIEMPTSDDRVVVSIQTDPININNTVITTAYVEAASSDQVIPSTFIPGNYIIDFDNPRTTRTPLPSLGSAMSEEDWMTLFYQMQTPKGATGLDSEMPVIQTGDSFISDCEASPISTCAQ